jgi:hypothetical protein
VLYDCKHPHTSQSKIQNMFVLCFTFSSCYDQWRHRQKTDCKVPVFFVFPFWTSGNLVELLFLWKRWNSLFHLSANLYSSGLNKIVQLLFIFLSFLNLNRFIDVSYVTKQVMEQNMEKEQDKVIGCLIGWIDGEKGYQFEKKYVPEKIFCFDLIMFVV